MKRIVLALVLVLVSGAAPAAWAECDLPAEIDRAGALIQRARVAVERTDVPEAKELLRTAVVRRDEAIDLGRSGRRESACRAARVAQGFASKAAEIARSGVQGLPELEEALRRTDQILRSVAGAVRESGSRDAARYFSTARKQQSEAWDAFRSRRPRFAMKLTTMARDNANQAARAAQRGERGGDRGGRPRGGREPRSQDHLDLRGEDALGPLGRPGKD